MKEIFWNPEVQTALAGLVATLLTVLTAMLTNFLRAQTAKIKAQTDSEIVQKYIRMAEDVVFMVVAQVQQVYVDALKKDGVFTAEAQQEAFYMAQTGVLNLLNDSAKDVIENVYGDLMAWLDAQIELTVAIHK